MFKRFFFLLFLCVYPLYGEENTLLLCENSLELYEWELDFIKQAKHSIEVSACFTGGKVFRTILEEIGKRIDECPDLQAFVLASPVLLEQREKDMVAFYREKYPNNFHIQITDAFFDPLPTYTGHENHYKCMIVDEHYFAIGGTNLDENVCVEGTTRPVRRPAEGIARNNFPGGMRDQDVIGSGPLAKELRHAFHNQLQMWETYFKTEYFDWDPSHFSQNNHYFPLEGIEKPYLERYETSPLKRIPHSLRLVESGPYNADNAITNEYVRLITDAKKEIAIANMYINPAKPILNALLSSVQNGIEYTVLTNGIWEEGPFFTHLFGWGNRMHYTPLFYGREFNFWEAWTADDSPLYKTRIFEYRIPDTMYHKKVMVVDRKYTFLGSYNFGVRSHSGDFELNIFVDSEEIAEDLLKVLNRDMTLSEEIYPHQALKWYFDPAISYWGSIQKLFNGFM